jgi:hypothetical protein
LLEIEGTAVCNYIWKIIAWHVNDRPRGLIFGALAVRSNSRVVLIVQLQKLLKQAALPDDTPDLRDKSTVISKR